MNMNNEQKNSYVKQQITTALLDLLKEKSITDISISELTQRAQIGRVSFYRNYQTKEDILKEESDRLIKEWGHLYETNPKSSPERSSRLSLISTESIKDFIPFFIKPGWPLSCLKRFWIRSRSLGRWQIWRRIWNLFGHMGFTDGWLSGSNAVCRSPGASYYPYLGSTEKAFLV